ncbi:MAG: hypothetical protein KBA46_01530 [Candidatus Omnitrophica bacterium]|nr:hypothetical protein [Candidatus Omnitrophota bacterium]
MVRLGGVRALFFMLSIVIAVPCFAQEIEKVADEFYNGLANVIEKNCSNSQVCVTRVKDYYKKNKDKVTQIRKSTEKLMEEIKPQLDKGETMSKADLAAFEKKAEQAIRLDPTISAGWKRYAQALKALSARSPENSSKIAVLALSLMPKGPSIDSLLKDLGME